MDGYEISFEIMKIDISSEEIDRILDKHIDGEKVLDEEYEYIIKYILQLFYRSGRRRSSTEEVHEKYNNLIGDRAIRLMDQMGIIDSFYDTEKEEYVYKLNEKGLKVANDNI